MPSGLSENMFLGKIWNMKMKLMRNLQKIFDGIWEDELSKSCLDIWWQYI
jgi:hypothetical protein